MSTPASGTRQISVIKWTGRENPLSNKEFISKESVSTMNEMAFASRSCLIENESKNDGKYSCSFCKKSFKWRSHWKSHERIHTGDRPFKCEICGKTFTRSDGLQCHRAIHATAIDSCLHHESRCTTYTAAQPNMRKFQEVQSSLPQCRLCDKRCYSFAGLMKHMQKHKGMDFA